MSDSVFVLPEAPERTAEWPALLPATLSPTSITTFLECPERFRRSYLQGEFSRVSGALVIGSADSDAAEANFLHKRDVDPGLDMPLGEVEERAAQSFDDRLGEEEVAWEDKAGEGNPGEAKDTLIRVVRANHRLEYPLVRKPVLVEHTVELAVEGIPVVARARLDVSEPGRVISRKTAARKPAGPSRAWLAQSAIESAALGLPTAWHVTTKTKTPALVAPETEGPLFEAFTVPGEASRLAAHMVGTAARGMRALLGEFGPDDHWPMSSAMHYGARPGGGQSACSYCAFRLKGCPAWTA